MAETTFCDLHLLTAPGRVMTPRPASELLVAVAAERLGGRAARVADVGTGSGAIAIGLARLAPNAEIWAGDVSAEAVELARANARRLGLGERVHAVQSDLLERLPSELDLIVANLPYLPGADRLRYPDLAGEPAEAVFSGGDGLGLCRRLLSSAEERLTADGAVLLQLHRRVLVAERDELAALRASLHQHVLAELPAAA